MTLFILFVSIIAILFLVLNLLFAPHNPGNWSRKSIIWDILSNSGEALKLLVPSISWKRVCGWINYSCMVISQKIIERLMGNRGSKLNSTKFVKEQRVYGSRYRVNKLWYLRCTLMDSERNYQVKILSNPISLTRNYSKFQYKLNPWYVSGFADGEGCFILTIIKDKKYKLGWRAACRFVISLNKKDLDLLNKIKDFFGVGNVWLTVKIQRNIV